MRGYWDRARSWARYMTWHYPYRTDGWTYGAPRTAGPLPPLTAADNTYLYNAAKDGKVDDLTYLADHFYGWGLLDWYLVSGDPLALEAATDLLEISRKRWGLGGYTFIYGMRNIARHLLFVSRYAEVTGDPAALAHAQHLAMLLKTTASWSGSWGMYLWPNSTPTRPKALSLFHIGILSHAFEVYHRLTGDAEIKRRMNASSRVEASCLGICWQS